MYCPIRFIRVIRHPLTTAPVGRTNCTRRDHAPLETNLAIKLGLWSKVKNQTQLKSGGAKICLHLRLDVEWKALRRLVLYDDGMIDYHVDPLAT